MGSQSGWKVRVRGDLCKTMSRTSFKGQWCMREILSTEEESGEWRMCSL